MVTCVSLDARRLFTFPKTKGLSLTQDSTVCVFVGYGQDEFGYRFYDPVQKKPIRSRDAVFVEDQTIKDQRRQIKWCLTPQNHVPVHDEDDLQGERPDAFDIPAQDEEEEQHHRKRFQLQRLNLHLEGLLEFLYRLDCILLCSMHL